jgi:hypothetical protein
MTMSSVPPSPDPDPEPGPVPSGLLHLRTWLEPDLDQGFSDWCDGHHADQLAIPGFRRVRRYSLVRSDALDPPDYLTIYDLDRLDVLDSDAYAAHRERATGLPEFLKGQLRAARTDAWVVASAPALDAMVPDGAGLAHLFVPDGPELADWFAEHGLAAVDAVGGTTARLLRAATGEQVMVIELDREPDDLDPSALPTPPETGEEAWGLYRLDHVATPEGPVASPHRDRRSGS